MTENISADPPVAGLLFDKDGTLFDFHRSWADWTAAIIVELSQAVPDRAAGLARALRFDLTGPRFLPDSPIIAGTSADIADVIVPLLPGWTADGLVSFLNQRAAQVPMVPAVALRPLLGRLSAAGYRLGVATNAGASEAAAHLSAAGIDDLFEFVAGFDTGHGPKPGPGMCTAFARATGLPPGRVAMIGDSLHDLHAGRAAGMRTVGVLTGLAAAADLAPHADVILADIGALPDWLSQGA